MLFIGTPCHLGSCRREDFLPVLCQNCGDKYCGEHFRPSQHECNYRLHPERRGHGEEGDYLVPLCPVCEEVPSGWRRGEDATVIIARHIDSRSCSALDEKLAETNRQRKRRENRCNQRRCEKIMIVRMECEKCHQAFCPSHRTPAQHACTAGTQRQQRATTKQASSSKKLSASAKPSGFAELAAMGRLAISGPSKSRDEAHETKLDDHSFQGKSNSNQSSDPFGLGVINSSIASRKIDKWVPQPIFGQA